MLTAIVKDEEGNVVCAINAPSQEALDSALALWLADNPEREVEQTGEPE